MNKLNSILKNVPLDLMWKLRKYHTRNGHHQIKWKAREPVEGVKYGYGGSLKWKDAKSADLYAYDRLGQQKRWEFYQQWQDTKADYEKIYEEYQELDDKYQAVLSLYRKMYTDAHGQKALKNRQKALKDRVVRMWRQWQPISWMLQKIIDFLIKVRERR